MSWARSERSTSRRATRAWRVRNGGRLAFPAHYVDSTNPQEQEEPVLLVQKQLGDGWMQINRNPGTFLLLLQEARSQGIVITEESVKSLLTNKIFPPVTDDEEKEKLAPAVSAVC